MSTVAPRQFLSTNRLHPPPPYRFLQKSKDQAPDLSVHKLQSLIMIAPVRVLELSVTHRPSVCQLPKCKMWKLFFPLFFVNGMFDI